MDEERASAYIKGVKRVSRIWMTPRAINAYDELGWPNTVRFNRAYLSLIKILDPMDSELCKRIPIPTFVVKIFWVFSVINLLLRYLAQQLSGNNKLKILLNKSRLVIKANFLVGPYLRKKMMRNLSFSQNWESWFY